jgi:hypothetical protein
MEYAYFCILLKRKGEIPHSRFGVLVHRAVGPNHVRWMSCLSGKVHRISVGV